MFNSNNSTENYGRRWARISFRGDLYSQESTFPLVSIVLLLHYYRYIIQQSTCNGAWLGQRIFFCENEYMRNVSY